MPVCKLSHFLERVLSYYTHAQSRGDSLTLKGCHSAFVLSVLKALIRWGCTALTSPESLSSFTVIIWMASRAYLISHFIFFVGGGIFLRGCSLIAVAVVFVLREVFCKHKPKKNLHFSGLSKSLEMVTFCSVHYIIL